MLTCAVAVSHDALAKPYTSAVTDGGHAPALVDKRDPGHRIAEIFVEDYFLTRINSATEGDIAWERCIPVYYPKGYVTRSIAQYQIPGNRWFACWYYSDYKCGTDWEQSGAFPTFYLEPDGRKNKIKLPIKSFKCTFKSDKKALLGSGPAKRDEDHEILTPDSHLVELYSDEHFNKRNFYNYLEDWASHGWCHTFSAQGNDAISSIRQFEHSQGKDYSCLYYALPDCNSDKGSFGKRGKWDQPDLDDQLKRPDGTWNNVIQSMECWYIK
ncbi:hypothetical protein BU23DRAFT_164670 [Bimuria novae-zelandiae CBS 107.79]|uniref:Uncharacterized protein n=1 Tax=Bimuria novae-zelandiae CBS 107.79 TaxID=1447943 RepID=A0A6A5V497_9PLEO|nr:hypothetical protein BU23DRAFT_164670 [Bimuria novae-zelandiae CBS 107.79]